MLLSKLGVEKKHENFLVKFTPRLANPVHPAVAVAAKNVLDEP